MQSIGQISVRNILLPVAGALLTACSNQHPTTTPRIYPDAVSAGAQVLLEQCSICHLAPLPHEHKVEEWPLVVARMQEHRISNGISPINAADQIELIAYLQKHAAKGS